MYFYGMHGNEDGTITMDKMIDVGKGNGFLGSRWKCEPVKTVPASEGEALEEEMAALNRTIALELKTWEKFSAEL